MKFPVNSITKLISRLVKLPVYASESSEGQPLYIDLIDGRLRLSTNRAIYSFEDKYDNFYQAFKKTAHQLRQDSHILVLGGGLGSVPYILEKSMGITSRYTIIEKEIEIIKLFNLYTKPKLKSLINIYCKDAAEYIQVTDQTYDLIVCDVFVDDEIPDEFKTEQFLQQCYDKLPKGGKLMFNYMVVTGSQKSAANEYHRSIFSRIFSDNQVLETTYNKIYLGMK